MLNLIRRLLSRTKDFTNWQFLIKSNFNLAHILGKSDDLKLEELRLERNELETRSKTLMQRQRSVECMLTDLTRSIKQMEFDMEQMQLHIQKLTTRNTPKEKEQEPKIEKSELKIQAKSQQKI